MAESAVVPISEWLSAFIPLGTYGEQAWTPVGAGVLIVDLPVVWLVTAKSIVHGAGATPLAAFLKAGEGSAILDLSESHTASGLSWLEHASLDLAATLFPINPAWEVKAFSQQQCAPAEELRPLLPVCSLGCPYGTIASPRPAPILLAGALAQVAAPHLHATAPLLPLNQGAPLILASGVGGAIQLAGILTRTLIVPEPDPRVPPVRLSEAVAMEAVWDLVRGEAALAQRKRAVERARGGPATPKASES